MIWGYLRFSGIEIQASERLYVGKESVILVLDQGLCQTERPRNREEFETGVGFKQPCHIEHSQERYL